MYFVLRTTCLLAAVLLAAGSRAQTPGRPDLAVAEPLATCKLQVVKNQNPTANEYAVVGMYRAPLREDPLANYQRTPLGGWHMPAEAEASDPWLRVLLLAPQRPVVIDIAVFVDGKPFRERREQWIDEVLAGAKANDEVQEVAAAVGNNLEASAGTNSVLPTSNDTASTTSDDVSDPEKPFPGIPAQTRQAPTMLERLKNYQAVVGPDVDREEVRWLIAESGMGPSVICLSASLSWQRAELAPLLAYLDQDGNGTLSRDELQQVDSHLQRADFNADDVVEVSEIRRATKRTVVPTVSVGTGHPLVVMLDDNTDWDSLVATLNQMYPGAEVGAVPQLQELRTRPAEMCLRVDLTNGGSPGDATSVSLVTLSDELEGSRPVSATEDVISVDLGGDYIEFAAARSDATESGASASQIAVGAVIDGNPLLRLLDRDEDGRLTRRERQELTGMLAALDRDGDGQIQPHEIPTPIRFAVTNGPHVHLLLATPTGAARAISARVADRAPDWFLSMDTNKDGDLSRDEFLGTTEQFRQFDENGDNLLSAAESLKLNIETE